ncbi:MAG: 23S rRNA (adenine(2030)-N(6))-methyltransferase RlmJ [Gammaproteobacteria bacterium]|nr:23S rRNA (adenine(2030)-N(6))-methyltransferase RlmJ [Gammaproteobacteria bacterium]
MLSYQHAYHAGNFADVIKHLTLSHILEYMCQKEKPMFYLDTHAGRGHYDLQDKHALKTKEAATGIEALWAVRNQLPKAFKHYIEAVSTFNQDGILRYYPGSPALAMTLLRREDRLFFCERHPREYEHLHRFVKRKPRAHCVEADGFQQITALLPPPERRGLIMIDPSYEIKKEYQHVPKLLQTACHLFQTGVYCVWYPIVDQRLNNQLRRGFDVIDAKNQLRAEFHLNPETPLGMTGCGLQIINPPFVLKETLEIIFKHLLKIFNPGRSSYIL